jgi:hypothetical protein
MATQTKPDIKSAADILRDAGEVFGEPLKEGIEYVIQSWTTRSQHFQASNGREARDGIQINLLMSVVGSDNEPEMYRCFSAVLLRQLEAIGEDNLPVKASFQRKETLVGRVDETGKRYAAWSILVD